MKRKSYDNYVLTGIYRPDGGEIYYKGKQTDIRTPKDAVKMGIGMVHQHFRLMPTLTVAENVFLYSDQKRFFLKRDQMKDGNAGAPFDEAYDMYDMETIEPVPAWQQIYDEVKEELRGMGIGFID